MENQFESTTTKAATASKQPKWASNEAVQDASTTMGSALNSLKHKGEEIKEEVSSLLSSDIAEDASAYAKKAVQWVKKHPYATAGILAAVGVSAALVLRGTISAGEKIVKS